MPLTKKGSKIKAAMTSQYGEKKGKQVFYASINAGKIHGAERTVGNNPMETGGSDKPHSFKGNDATVHKGVYYFKDRKSAEEHARSTNVPNARIVEYERGHAVQAGPSGGYSGPGISPKEWRGTVGNNPMPTAGSREPHRFSHTHNQGKLRVSGDPRAHQIGKR